MAIPLVSRQLLGVLNVESEQPSAENDESCWVHWEVSRDRRERQTLTDRGSQAERKRIVRDPDRSDVRPI
jgi:hypothetical protein